MNNRHNPEHAHIAHQFVHVLLLEPLAVPAGHALQLTDLPVLKYPLLQAVHEEAALPTLVAKPAAQSKQESVNAT